MSPLIDEDEKGKDFKNEEYLATYIKHLEARIQELESEIKLLDSERIRLEENLNGLKKEIDRFGEVPLITGTLIDFLDNAQEKAIVKSTTGPDLVVNVSKRVASMKLVPGTNVALHQNTCAVVEVLPTNKDPFVKGMELLDNVPNINYQDVGGLDDQIQEVRETVELPLLKPDLFIKVGIDPPKGILLHGPPGTGKTLLAKAVAHETAATFIRIIGSELVDKFIGEGARYVREIFTLAREKAPTILFIDELDAIGAMRTEDSTSGDREVQRTLMQILSELDGFEERGNVRFIGATNRIDLLDPAFLRPGRFDRIVEIPLPNEEARSSIFKVHMRRLNIDSHIKIEKLVQMTDNASGAEIKAICTEAGMFAIRENSEVITEKFFLNAIKKVLMKKQNEDISTSNYM